MGLIRGNLLPAPSSNVLKHLKIFDEKGLYLLITTKASKCWRFKYRFGGKEKVLVIGLYPDISYYWSHLKGILL
jgi:hypothetical protein